jgi:DNA-binding CsgD family transcriptional regulator
VRCGGRARSRHLERLRGGSRSRGFALSDRPRPLAYASALEDLGRVLAQNGDSASAIAALDEALIIATRVGASWDVTRLRARLRRLGVRRRPAKIDRPKTGWEALTEAESVVANLTAHGCTNREIADKLFISPHTVNTHVRHVFEKLGVNSRVQLTRLVAERSPQSPPSSAGASADAGLNAVT